ncbi:MAG: alcohol dehydrogenase zinc-binding domain containing protein [Thermoleophilia bacterium]|nr:alcohol dehydrogenase zinc-binding domain containing protein [Thermoleophilia bacterium]
MQAIVRDKYGEADRVLRLEQVDMPWPSPDEVLVRVHAAGVDRGAWHVMAGLPYPIRLAGFGVRAPKQRILGTDFAGTVEAIGEDVTDLLPGDEVFGVADGAYAEHALARADQLALKPVSLSFEQAAAVPTSACAALQAVRDHGHVKPGDSVLVIGASGGVGSFAVQIAKAFGATVTGVCSGAKFDMVRALGADHVIDYRAHEIDDDGRIYDVILDIAGNRPLATLRRALTPKGTLVIVGGETSGRWLGGSDRQLRAMALSPFVGQHLGTFIASETRDDLRTLADMIDGGRLIPVVDRIFPLAHVAQAIDDLQAGKVRGKAVITIP